MAFREIQDGVQDGRQSRGKSHIYFKSKLTMQSAFLLCFVERKWCNWSDLTYKLRFLSQFLALFKKFRQKWRKIGKKMWFLSRPLYFVTSWVSFWKIMIQKSVLSLNNNNCRWFINKQSDLFLLFIDLHDYMVGGVISQFEEYMMLCKVQAILCTNFFITVCSILNCLYILSVDIICGI